MLLQSSQLVNIHLERVRFRKVAGSSQRQQVKVIKDDTGVYTLAPPDKAKQFVRYLFLAFCLHVSSER